MPGPALLVVLYTVPMLEYSWEHKKLDIRGQIVCRNRDQSNRVHVLPQCGYICRSQIRQRRREEREEEKSGYLVL